MAQAGAAAAEAWSLIDKGHIEQEPNTAYIVADECSGCKSCIPLCPYTAITLRRGKKKAVINEALCKGCGTCVASCPSGSIVQNLFEDEEIFSEIEGVLGRPRSSGKNRHGKRDSPNFRQRLLVAAHRGVFLQLVHLHGGGSGGRVAA